MPGLSEKLVTEFEDLQRQRPYTAYGIDVPNKAQKKRAAKKKPEAGALEFSLLPAAEPEVFSREELRDLATDHGFASKILESYTGIQPTQQQVLALQKRASDKYPNIQKEQNIKYNSMSDVMKSFINDLFTIHETGDFKPLVDLASLFPDIALSDGISDAIKQIKAGGYKETVINKKYFDRIRRLASNYAKYPGGKSELLEKAASGNGFVGAEHAQRNASIEKTLSNLKSAALPTKEKREAVSLRMREARNIEEEVENLKDASRRIAPLNEVHEQAKQLLNRGIGRDTLETARDKIAAAERMDVASEIAPYLQDANIPTQEFLQQYMTDYSPVIEGFRQEAAKDFLEHDLPKINNQFASKGAFFSGAREAALNKARTDKEARLEREISKLMTHGHEQAMKHSHMHREGKLKSAEIAGNARKSQKEGLQHAAEALRANAQVEHGANLQHVAALSGVARTQQEQAQHEIDVRMAEHREQQERPFVELARKSTIAQGHPLPAFNFSPMGINPPPPNVYGLGSNIIGQAAGLHKMGYGAGEQYKKGGHVRTKHAKGDSISRHAAEFQQIGQHMEGTPSAQIADESMREARSTRHHRIDPMGAYLMALSSHQMASPGKSMMQSFGEGSKMAYDAFNAAKVHNVDAKQKSINMMNAIHKSRMDQQALLADYHLKRSHHEETQRYHNMANAESIRSHNMMNERHTEKPVKISATEKKLENDAQKDLLRASRMKKEIQGLESLITQTETGPAWGVAKSLWPKTKTDNKIEVATNKLILDMHQGMKNIPRSEEFLKRIETTKPNRSNYLESNQQALHMMDQGADDVMEHAITTLLSSGWSPEKIEKKFKIKIPRHLLEEGESEDAPSPDNSEHEDGYTWMLGPGDSEAIEVANSDVPKALKRGAKVV